MLKLLTLVCIFLVGNSFLGDFHPFFDSLAVFRLYFALPLLLCLGIYMLQKSLLWVFSCLALMMISIFSIYSPQSMYDSFFKNTETVLTEYDYSLYQKNLSYRMAGYEKILADIATTNPDFITLQEVTEAHTSILSSLKDSHPYQQLCPFSRNVGGVALLSKFPITEQHCLHGVSLAYVQTPQKPFWLASLHAYWPWPFKQHMQIQDVLAALQPLAGDKVIAGDFNMVNWAYLLKNFSARLNVAPLAHIHYSYFIKRFFPIAIDQVFTPSGSAVSSSIRPYLGSDHKGLYVKFSFDS